MKKIFLASVLALTATACHTSDNSATKPQTKTQAENQTDAPTKIKTMTADSVAGENYIVYNVMGGKNIYKMNLASDGSGTLLTREGTKKLKWDFSDAEKKLSLNLQDTMTEQGYVPMQDTNGSEIYTLEECKIGKIELQLNGDIKAVETKTCTYPEPGLKDNSPTQNTNESESTDIVRELQKFEGVQSGESIVLPLSDFTSVIQVRLGEAQKGTVTENKVEPALTTFDWKLSDDRSELELTFNTGKILTYQLIAQADGRMSVAVAEKKNSAVLSFQSAEAVMVGRTATPDIKSFSGSYSSVVNDKEDASLTWEFSEDGIAMMKSENVETFYSWTLEYDTVKLTRYSAKSSTADQVKACVAQIEVCNVGLKRSFRLVSEKNGLLVMHRYATPMHEGVEEETQSTLMTYKKTK